MDISQKKNINCVHGVSKYSAEEYFLPGHAGRMTLYDEVHSPGLATIQQQLFCCFSQCVTHLVMQEIDFIFCACFIYCLI